MGKTILFVGGGIETVPGIEKARAMGYQTVVSDRNPEAPCFSHADAHFIADTYDPKATLLGALEYQQRRGPIDGVLCLGSDIPWTVAVVAQALNLPGIPLSSAALAMDKLAMKDCLSRHGVPVPFYRAIPNAGALQQLLENREGSLVIKPVDSRGARGVIRLSADVDPHWAFAYARDCSPTGRVMAEAYLDGPQISTESLVVDGVTHTPGISDRNYSLLDTYAPFFIEDGGDLPSYLPEETLREIRHLVADAASAMGIQNGVLKGDIVVHEGKPYIIEVAARLSGGYFCTHSIPANTGVAFVEQAIRLALGETVDTADLQPRFQKYVCQRYLFPKPGRVTAIEGAETVLAHPAVAYLEIRVELGSIVAPIENHPARAGVLMTTGETREEAARVARWAVETVRITTDIT